MRPRASARRTTATNPAPCRLSAAPRFFLQNPWAATATAAPSSLTTTGIQPPIIGEGNDSVYAQYTLLAEDRNALSQRLKASGIPSVAYYTAPLHLQGAFANLGHKPGDFPIAETIAARCLSLPMSPYLSESDQKKVSAAIKME